MKIKLPLDAQDLKLLRIPIVVLLICVALALGLYIGATRVDISATRALSDARTQYEQASSAVQLIAQEEATIIRYTDRYKEFSEAGYVADEDRLALIENIATIRNAYNLYPISIDIGEQNNLALAYDPNDLNPGDPVNLRYSNMEMRFGLLHEEDLTRFMNSLLATGGLLIPTYCQMKINDINESDFTVFAEHIGASCTVSWYTFDINPSEPTYEEF